MMKSERLKKMADELGSKTFGRIVSWEVEWLRVVVQGLVYLLEETEDPVKSAEPLSR